jgi:hypothetical protein
MRVAAVRSAQQNNKKAHARAKHTITQAQQTPTKTTNNNNEKKKHLNANATTKQHRYVLGYGVFFFEALTVPVTLLMLALPVRLYVMLLVVPAATLVGLLATLLRKGFLQPAARHDDVYFACVVLVAALIVNTACAVRAAAQERVSRKLFLLHSSLQAQAEGLWEDAAFRQYREVMRANRQAAGVGYYYSHTHNHHHHGDGSSNDGGGGGGDRDHFDTHHVQEGAPGLGIARARGRVRPGHAVKARTVG